MKTNSVNDWRRSYPAPETEIVSLMSPDIICTSTDPLAIEGGDAGAFEENEW